MAYTIAIEDAILRTASSLTTVAIQDMRNPEVFREIKRLTALLTRLTDKLDRVNDVDRRDPAAYAAANAVATEAGNVIYIHSRRRDRSDGG